MNLPIAPINTMNVSSAIILDDNIDNVIHINIEAKQLINQMAFLEVFQDEDIQEVNNYDNESLRTNFSISTNSTRNNNSYIERQENEGKLLFILFFIIVIVIVIFVRIK